MNVTFLRVRPAMQLAEPSATSRRKEGTTTVEMPSPSSAEVEAGHRAGVLVVAESVSEVTPASWVVSPSDALALAAQGVAGWRITVLADGPKEAILDAVARSGAGHLRCTRSETAEMASLADLPGLEVSVSVFVDDVAQALAGTRCSKCAPHLPKGAPVIWPQQQLTPIYHNRGIWPFVTAFWTEAGKHQGNVSAVARDMGDRRFTAPACSTS